MPGDRDWLWKDPRNCLTLPFWLELINRPVAAVLIHRNPLEVAASLARRDGFASALSLALWEHYVRCSLLATAGMPALVTSYELLLSDPVGWCEQARGFLASLGAQVSSPDSREISAFVQPALRHSAYSSSDRLGDVTISRSQHALHKLLGALEGMHEKFDAPDIPLPTPWVKPLLEERRQRNALERELTEVRHSVGSMRELLDHQSRALDLALEEVDALRAALESIVSSKSWRLTCPLRKLWGSGEPRLVPGER
ncbi:MAG: hypothetical protein IRZ17_16610 [Mycolicibacterium hassiacum]|uniref:hypothetical protein n=1 Tax=Mycolicibacterium hassiacum TaxID=46351 RepID=UPI0023F6540C|nr:hypothetical protein [Mycolicibacterium hassiacum]MBX5488216.1 hypothetical protein [Mycolicibacterium hassiacum]